MFKPTNEKWTGVPVESRMLRSGEFIEFQRVLNPETGWVHYRVIDFRGKTRHASWSRTEHRFAEGVSRSLHVVVNLILSLELGRNEPDA